MFNRNSYEIMGILYVILLTLFLVLEFTVHPPFILTIMLSVVLLALLVVTFVAILAHTRRVQKEEGKS